MVEVLGEGNNLLSKGFILRQTWPYNCNPGLDQIKPENLDKLMERQLVDFFGLSRLLLQRNIKIKEFSSSQK